MRVGNRTHVGATEKTAANDYSCTGSRHEDPEWQHWRDQRRLRQDTRTFEVIDRIELANGPHNLSASHTARKVYVAIIREPLIQVIDMDSHEIIANIETGGGVHNTFVTPDGKYAVGGMIGASEIIAIVCC